jgi:hypothetical protein
MKDGDVRSDRAIVRETAVLPGSAEHRCPNAVVAYVRFDDPDVGECLAQQAAERPVVASQTLPDDFRLLIIEGYRPLAVQQEYGPDIRVVTLRLCCLSPAMEQLAFKR